MSRNGLFLVVTLLATCLLLANCGPTPAPAPTRYRAGSAVETVAVERAIEVTQVVEALPAGVEATAAPGGPTLTTSNIPRAERMIIKNAEMELLVADTDVALDSITLLVADYGGYIISNHTWFEGEFKLATVRLGVPSQEFENVLRRLRGLSIQVLNEVVSGEDVTDQYVDLQSRLTNLQAT